MTAEPLELPPEDPHVVGGHVVQYRNDPDDDWRDLPRELGTATTLEEAWASAQAFAAARDPRSTVQYRVAAIYAPVQVAPAAEEPAPDRRQQAAADPTCGACATTMRWHTGASRWVCPACEARRAEGVPRARR